MTPDRFPYVRTIVLPPNAQDELRPMTPGAWFDAKLTLALRDSAAETCWRHPPGVRLELDFMVTSP